MSDYTGYEHGYFAAMDVLAAGGSHAEASAAARSAIRSGGIVDWNQRYIARRAAELAIEEFKRRLVETLTTGE